MSTALIVANQTLPSPALADAINERIRKGVTAFYVVVPATPITHGLTWDEDATRGEARDRLNQFLAHLRDRGVAADGEVGDRDPVAAVRDAIRGREVDEVVLSTLPPGISALARPGRPEQAPPQRVGAGRRRVRGRARRRRRLRRGWRPSADSSGWESQPRPNRLWVAWDR